MGVSGETLLWQKVGPQSGDATRLRLGCILSRIASIFAVLPPLPLLAPLALSEELLRSTTGLELAQVSDHVFPESV